MRTKYKRTVGFTLELVKHLRFEHDKAKANGIKVFWFPIGYDPKQDMGIEAELDTDYAGLMLEYLEPQFGIVLQNSEPASHGSRNRRPN